MCGKGKNYDYDVDDFILGMVEKNIFRENFLGIVMR